MNGEQALKKITEETFTIPNDGKDHKDDFYFGEKNITDKKSVAKVTAKKGDDYYMSLDLNVKSTAPASEGAKATALIEGFELRWVWTT
jgi:hypothetical protein